MPRAKLRFKVGIHNILFTNWKEPIDLLKKTHKNKEIIYTIQETFNATAFNIEWLEAGMQSKIKVPINGVIKIKTSKSILFINKTSNINIL